MQRWRGYEAAPGGWGRSVVTIGVFDGVHRGHQETIGHAVARARELGVAVGGGDLRPAPGRGGPPRLAPGRAHRAGPQGGADRGARRRRALRDAVHPGVLPAAGRDSSCTTSWSSTCTPRWSWSARTSGSGTGRPATWRCWSGSAGPSASRSRARRWSPRPARSSPPPTSAPASTPATWRRRPPRWAARTGWRASWSAATSAAGSWASRPPTCSATGTRRSRPTGSTRPGWSAAGTGEPLPAAVSIGTNPTFSGRERRVEAYVLDFDRRPVRRAAGPGLRRPTCADSARYDAIEPLVAQIAEDVERTRRVLG